jgi:hypothetical protein
MEDVMIRISVLWIFYAVANSAHYAMYLFEPGVLQKTLSGETTLSPRGAIMEAFASWLIPLTMAFLSVTLEDSANRNLNMALGGIATLWGIIHIAICPIIHIRKKPSIHQLLICISTVAATALILWYAWNWHFLEGRYAG